MSIDRTKYMGYTNYMRASIAEKTFIFTNNSWHRESVNTVSQLGDMLN